MLIRAFRISNFKIYTSNQDGSLFLAENQGNDIIQAMDKRKKFVKNVPDGPILASPETVSLAIRSFPLGSAGGPDGLRPPTS